MKKRSRAQIVLQILSMLAEEDRRKTVLVYELNLNFRTINRYLERLVEFGAVAWNERTNRWFLTTFGRETAAKLREVEAVL